jgi:hypothetical protein
MIDFEEIIISKEKEVQDRIQEALSGYKKLYLEYSIDWTEYECSMEIFNEFSIDKLSKSMAYGTETMSKDQAKDHLTQLKGDFESDCRYFTNWDDVEIDGINANGWTPVTKHTFDCSLIIMDKTKIGIIILIDED